MKRPGTSSIAVFVVIVLVAAVITVAVGLGTDGATAIAVGDRTMSAKAVNEELAAFVDNEDFTNAVEAQGGRVSNAPGTIVSGGATGLVTLMVYEMMLEQALDRAGERVTSADRSEGAAQARDSYGAGYPAFPRWLRDRLARRGALIVATQRVGGDDGGFNRFIRRAARQFDVTVDPAYGRWSDARIAVEPYPTPFTPQG